MTMRTHDDHAASVNCPHQGEGWCLGCVKDMQDRRPSSTTWTHDVDVEMPAIIDRLSQCDGTHSDAAIVCWEHCQKICQEHTGLVNAVGKALKLLVEHGDPFDGDDWEMVQDLRASLKANGGKES